MFLRALRWNKSINDYMIVKWLLLHASTIKIRSLYIQCLWYYESHFTNRFVFSSPPFLCLHRMNESQNWRSTTIHLPKVSVSWANHVSNGNCHPNQMHQWMEVATKSWKQVNSLTIKLQWKRIKWAANDQTVYPNRRRRLMKAITRWAMRFRHHRWAEPAHQLHQLMNLIRPLIMNRTIMPHWNHTIQVMARVCRLLDAIHHPNGLI